MRTATSIDPNRLGFVPLAPREAHAPEVSLAGIELQPNTIFVALASLEEVARRLRAAGDPRAVFPDVYAVITRNVIAAIQGRRGPRFLEPEWIGRLAGLFCTRYFKALAPHLRGGRVASEAWRIGFEKGQPGDDLPVVDALLGINAHINFDLAQGLVDNIRFAADSGQPVDRQLARYLHDHDAVNQILRDSLPEIFEVLIHRHHCAATRLAVKNPLVRRAVVEATMLVLRRWRARVWTETLALYAADCDLSAARMVRNLDRASGDLAKAIRFSARLVAPLLCA